MPYMQRVATWDFERLFTKRHFYQETLDLSVSGVHEYLYESRHLSAYLIDFLIDYKYSWTPETLKSSV